MTTTTFFTGSAPSSSANTTGKHRAAPVTPRASKTAVGASSAGPVAAYPWLTQAMFSQMGTRARRLLRADH